MNTVDSWIDPDHIANILERLNSAPGSAVKNEEEAAPEPAPVPARRGETAPADSARLAAEADAAMALSSVDADLEDLRSEAPAHPGFPAFPDLSVTAAGGRGKGVSDSAVELAPVEDDEETIPGVSPARTPDQPSAREQVRRRLAEIKAQAARSGLLNPIPVGEVAQDPFSSAEEEPAALPEADVEEVELGKRLRGFAESVKERFGCVRVFVSDSQGVLLIPNWECEPMFLSAAQTLSKSWLSCQRDLQLKDPGVLSSALGKGYRLVVIPCETARELISLSLVTRDLVSDAETVKLRGELMQVLEA